MKQGIKEKTVAALKTSAAMIRMLNFFSSWCHVVFVGIFLCAGECIGDTDNRSFLINGNPFSDTVCWNVTLKAGSAGGLFGDTLGPVRTFRYETVVEVDGKVTLVIPGGIYSTDMGSSAASYTVKIPLKDLGILIRDDICRTYYLKAYTRSYEGDSKVDIGYSLLYVDSTVTVEYDGKIPEPRLNRLILKGVNVESNHVATTSITNFLVAGNTITVEAEVLDYDPNYYTLISAKLIGTPNGFPAKQKHEVFKFIGTVGKTEHFSEGIVFPADLKAQKGFHGEYTWKVEAIFRPTEPGNDLIKESVLTNAPVFFHKYGTDGSMQCGVPNCFIYWKEDGACPGLNTPNLQGFQKNSYGVYNPDQDVVFINPYNASWMHYTKIDIVTNRLDKTITYPFSGPHIYGIYTVEEVIAHELCHRKLYKLYESWINLYSKESEKIKDSDNYGRWEAVFSVEIEPDVGQCEKRDRPWCDYLVDLHEIGTNYHGCYGFDIKNTDTYALGKRIGIKSLTGESDYAAYGDNEFLARIAANKATEDVNAKKENDWAFPGEQTCVPIETMKARWDLAQSNKVNGINRDYGWYVREDAVNNSMRAGTLDQSVATHQAQAKLAAPCSESDPLSVTVNGMTKEVVYDENSSLAFAVSYKLDMEVRGLQDLRLSGVLTDLNSNIVAYANTSVTSGNVVGELRFKGSDIYESGKNGPFKLESVKLVSFTGNDFSDLATLGEFKDGVVELNRKDLARNDAYLLDVANETVSTNGIEVAINAEINAAGEYEIFATLGSTNGMPVATYRKAIDCSAGTNSLKVVFAASQIFESGVDGPYIIDNLAIFKDGVRIDSRLDYSILRKNYRADAFDFEEGEKVDSDQFMSQFEDYTPPPVLTPPERFWVFFNPNGGTVSETFRQIVDGEMVGALPIPQNGDDEFLGWFTELKGGIQISETTIITTNVLYHAHWKGVAEEVTFTGTEFYVKENDTVVVTVTGGSKASASSVQLYATYNTAAAADIDLAKTLVDGKPVKGFKFPYTLSWGTGEVGERRIEIPIKADKVIEDNEIFTLQLANPVGMILGEYRTCTITIKDQNTAVSLADSILNHTLKPTSKGDGKWIPVEAAFDDPSDTNYFTYAVSPLMKSGQQSSLALASVKGTGTLCFSLKFIGEDKGSTLSKLYVFDGAEELGWLSTYEYGDEWQDWSLAVKNNSSHNLSFKFVQGDNSTVQAKLTDVCWIPDKTFYQGLLLLKPEPACGGYTLGGGIFPKTANMKIEAKPRPGWTFDGWYDSSGSLWGKKIKTTVEFLNTTSNGGAMLVAKFSKIPYVRALADPADGGKVSGSGPCAEGKKVTLKASANKNFTFKGWYASLPGDPNSVDMAKCVATTASLVIDCSAKPAANSKTSTTIAGITADVTYFAIFEGDPRVTVMVEPNDAAGKITGIGRYAPNKKVSLKATANKGYVFSGWYDGESLVSQAASYAFTMPDEDVALAAKFITSAEDAASVSLCVDALGGELEQGATVYVTNHCGVALKWSIAANALSQPTVAVSGLPAGLKFTAKDIVDKKTKQVAISANTVYGVPTAESKPDAKTGVRKPSAVKVTVTTAGKSKVTYPVEMTILPLPDWVVGMFDGGGDHGQVSISVAKTGKLSGKYLSEGLTWSLAADSFDSIDDSGNVYRATLVGKSGKLSITNEIGVARDDMGGFVESLDYIAFQNNWKLEPWKTVGKPFAKAAALEYEDVAAHSIITLKFASSGAVAANGSFAVGVDEKTGKEIVYSASGSAVLAPRTEIDENGAFEGVVFVYFPPKAGEFDGYVRYLAIRWTGEAWTVVP